MSGDSTDLDELIHRVDPDRWLSSRFIADPAQRAHVIALYAFDHELARAPKVASNPILGEIRLTWWGEVLDEIYEDRHVRHHPTAQALAQAARTHQLPRAPLQAMIEARYPELDGGAFDEAQALAWARGTGGLVAAAAARILDPGADAGQAASAGAAWALSRRIVEAPALRPAFERLLADGRREARGLSVAAFPAVAHAVFAQTRARGEQPAGFASRMKLTLAVARGRL